jgi:F-type H+-transporting ATPase subunit epsilon
VVNVLADTAVRGNDLDAEAARRAKEDAERTLAEKVGGVDTADAEKKLAEALAQLQALETMRRERKT